MIKLNKAFSIAMITLAASLSFAASAKVDQTIEKIFELTGKGQLMLENVNGDVTVESWAKQSVKVTAYIVAKDQEGLDRVEVKMKQSNNRITVETDYRENNGDWGRNSSGGSVEYTVMVPANIDLRELDLVNGSLVITNVSGELNADVVNGSIEATGLASNVEVESVNGSVNLTFADTTKNIDVEVETVNGSIRLYFADDFGAALTASTGNGSIKTDFGLEGTKGKYYGTDLEGSFGSGSSELELESVNGSIKVLKK